MARKPFKTAEQSIGNDGIPEGHAVALTAEAEERAIEEEMMELALKDAGAFSAFAMVAKISDRAMAEIYIRQEKTKAYRALNYKTPDGDRKKIPDIETYCDLHFGKSGRAIRGYVQNYHLLGPELYDAAERLGFKGRDYTALKALPADDQEVIKQAMQADDRDTILSLMQELAAKHQSEKAALTAEATEAKETAEARDQVVKAKEAKITQLEEANHKLKRRVETATPDQVGEQLRDEVGQFAFGAEAQILGNLRAGFQALAEHADANGVTHENFMSGCLAQIEAALLTVRAEFGVKARPDADPAPDWVKDDRPVDEILGAELGGDLKRFQARMAGQQA